jgi:Caspase domain
MTHPNRGVVVTLNHKFFEKMNTRQGTTKDCKDIESTLKALQFDVHVCTDYTYEDIRAKIKQSKFIPIMNNNEK